MYTPGFGSCSSLIHLIAKYPKITLGVGVLAVISYLVSPVGPGVHLDSKKILAKQDSRIAASAQPIMWSAFVRPVSILYFMPIWKVPVCHLVNIYRTSFI